MIQVENITKKYGSFVAVNDISFEIDEGEIVGFLGPNGAGKSTFIKMLYREEKPTSGEIIVGGINVAKLRNNKVYKLRRKLGIVFQDYRLLPKLTVYENVAFTMESLGATKGETRKKVLKALELVGLKAKIHNYPDQLSGGEQQRVAIARAIVNEPRILLCDEPTGNLDPDRSMEIVKVLEEINKTCGTTIIMATHDKEIVNKMQKEVVLLKDGRLIKHLEKGGYEE